MGWVGVAPLSGGWLVEGVGLGGRWMSRLG